MCCHTDDKHQHAHDHNGKMHEHEHVHDADHHKHTHKCCHQQLIRSESNEKTKP